MEITIMKPTKVDIKVVAFNVPIYLDDIEFNRLDFDTLMYNFNVSYIPQSYKEKLNIKAKVDVSTGKIIGWQDIGSDIDIYAKVVDEGIYMLLGKYENNDSDEYEDNYEVICEYDGYVPNIFARNEEGYGDYFNMTITKDGKILNWEDNLKNNIIKMIDEYRITNNYER